VRAFPDAEAAEMMQPFKRVVQTLNSNPPAGLRWRQDFSAAGGNNSNPISFNSRWPLRDVRSQLRSILPRTLAVETKDPILDL
jgi:hypothetical protein